MCRTQLEEIIRKVTTDENGDWKYYECPNCGTAIYLNPFYRVKEGKLG